jgi:cobalt-zinc-cadmium efflux system outer membrane protein
MSYRLVSGTARRARALFLRVPRRLTPLLFAVFAVCHAPALVHAQDRPLTLAEVLQRARDNVEVSLARRAADAARADVAAADHAPVPVLSAKAASIDLQNGVGGGNLWRDKRIDKSLGIDWTWERGGKRAARTLSAQRAADAAEADLQEAIVQQQIAAAAAFYELLSAQEREEQVEALERSARELAGHAARRVSAGDIARQDALRLEIEAQRAQTDLRTTREDRRRAAQALTLLTGLPAPAVAQGRWPEPPATAPGPAEPVVEDRADVRAARQRVESARAALDTAVAMRRNDVTLGASIDHFPGTSTRQVELRLQVPLAGLFGAYGYEGEVSRARAQLDLATDQFDKTLRAARSEQQRLQLDLAASADRVRTQAGSIVPRARQVAAMAELAYAKGASSLTELIEARRTLRAAQLDELAARTDHARLLAAWELRLAPGSAPQGAAPSR